MAVDVERSASRRHVLTAGLGALGGLIASRLGHPEPAAAAQGDTVTVGGTFQGTNTTSIENTVVGGISLRGYQASQGTAVVAELGGTGTALLALGQSAGARGVRAQTLDMEAVLGHSQDTTPAHPGQVAGVVGIAGDDTDIAPDLSESGVYGYCNTSSQYAAGVWGDSVIGAGVAGSGTWGVIGVGGIGLYGIGTVALRTEGKLQFSGRSGHSYVAKGATYKDVLLAGMTSGADGLAVLRSHVGGFYVSAVVSYTGKIRVYLNKAATTNIYFNFLVMNG